MNTAKKSRIQPGVPDCRGCFKCRDNCPRKLSAQINLNSASIVFTQNGEIMQEIQKLKTVYREPGNEAKKNSPETSKNFLLTKRAKIIVDILLAAGFILVLIFSYGISKVDYWASPHCIIGLYWLLLGGIHVYQHWKLIKAFTKKKVILKNKITAFTILSFVLMSVSIVFFLFGYSPFGSHFHHIIGHLFSLMVIIHTASKFKRFTALMRKSEN